MEEDIGILKSQVAESRAETKKALNLITGNGRPEDGILYIVSDIRKGIKDLHEWVKSHDIVHSSINDCIQKHDLRLNTLETEEKVENAKIEGAESLKANWKAKAMTLLKNPVVWTAVAGLLASITGWNKETIIRILTSMFGG
jgi:predicted permease